MDVVELKKLSFSSLFPGFVLEGMRQYSRLSKFFLITFILCGLSACGGSGSAGVGTTQFVEPDDAAVIVDDVDPFLDPSNEIVQSISVENNESDTVSIEFSWSGPLWREDGSEMQNNHIQAFNVYWRSESAEGVTYDSYMVSGWSEQYTISDLPRGEHLIAVTAVDLGGQESQLSDLVEVLF